MTITNPKKIISVERLSTYHTKDKTERATEISTAVNAEASTRASADTTLQGNIDAITAKIPSDATSTNKLTSKSYVDESIEKSEATFRGNFNTKADLDAYTGDKDKNDTAVVQKDETKSDQCSMYQYDGTNWVYKYKINDAPFTTEQLAAINSGANSTKITSYDTHIAAKNNPHEVTPVQVFSDYVSNAGKIVHVKTDGTGFDYLTTYTAGDGIVINTSNAISMNEASDSDIDEIFV